MKSKAIELLNSLCYGTNQVISEQTFFDLYNLIKQDLESCYEKSEVLDRDSFEDFVKILKVEN